MDEAVKAHSSLGAKEKRKARVKKPVNPFLPQQENNTDDSDHTLFPEKSEAYEQERKRLLQTWACKQHPNLICMAHAMNGHHKTIGFEVEMTWVLVLVRQE
jgi:hypothetical protein